MKKLAILTLILHSFVCTAQNPLDKDLFDKMSMNEKAAVIGVHPYSSDEAKGQKGIQNINAILSKQNPQINYFEAYISEKGTSNASLTFLLNELHSNGYTRVLIQPTCFADDSDMDYVRNEVLSVSGKLAYARIGAPLLSNKNDIEEVMKDVVHECGDSRYENILLFKTTENDDECKAYTHIEYMLHDLGYTNWHVATSDSYPSAESLINTLKIHKNKKVNLIPFTLIETRALYDETIKIADKLKKAKFKVAITSKPITQINNVIQLFAKHAESARFQQPYTALEKRMMQTAWQK